MSYGHARQISKLMTRAIDDEEDEAISKKNF